MSFNSTAINLKSILLSTPSNHSDGSIQTIGHGLERDVIYSAFNGYIRSFTKWFMPRFDNRASLQMSCGFWRAISAGVISEARILDMKKLGAICALMLIHGICPEPLKPLIFQFIIHNGDFNSLHRGLVQEWHPELLDLITRWLAVGPTGSLEPFRLHFAIYHDMDVSSSIQLSLSDYLTGYCRYLSSIVILWLVHLKSYTMRYLALNPLSILSGKPLCRASH